MRVDFLAHVTRIWLYKYPKLWDHEARVQVGGGMRNDMADERKGWKEPTVRSYARRRDLHNHFHVTLDLDR
jgi:hypothetical protein